jgi:hypothetical protein
MLTQIQWYDKDSRTIYCRVEGVWSYSGFNQLYTQLIHHARQVAGKINLILDVSQAETVEAVDAQPL